MPKEVEFSAFIRLGIIRIDSHQTICDELCQLPIHFDIRYLLANEVKLYN